MQQYLSQNIPHPPTPFSIIIPSPKIQYHELKTAKQRDIQLPMNSNPKQLIRVLKNQAPCELSIPQFFTTKQAAQYCFEQYLIHFHQNQFLNNELVEVIHNRNQLAQKYNHLKRANLNEDDQIVRRKRRSAHEIARMFICPIAKCHKGYGTQGSLSHHVRLKHTQYFENGELEFYLAQYYRKVPEMDPSRIRQKEKQKRNEEKALHKAKQRQTKKKQPQTHEKTSKYKDQTIVKIQE